MANSTLTPHDSDRKEDQLNPGQAHYDREFDSIAKNYDKTADSKQEDANAERARLRDQEGSAGLNDTSQEKDPKKKEGDTPWAVNMAATAASAAGVKVPFLTKKRGGIAGIVIGLIIALLLGAGALTPFGVFIQLKEVATSWADKYNRTGYYSRMGKVYQKRYLGSKTCTGIKCKLMPNSIGDKELNRLREAGLNPQTDARGRIAAFELDNGDGTTTRLTSANFLDNYRTNPKLVSALNRATAPPNALAWRGPQALKRLAVLGIDRSKTPRNTQEMRQRIYSSVQRLGIGRTAADEDADRKQLIDGVGEDAQRQAAEIREGALQNGPPADRVPDIGTFDPGRASEILSPAELGQATLKGATLNAFGSIDGVCTAYQFVKLVSFGAKVYQARDLIRYASVFMIAADMAKAGKIDYQQAGYIAGILLKPSTEATTKGKTFADSEGYTLITQGKVQNRGAMARMTNGTPALQLFEDIINKANGVGGGAVCSKVKSWYGQGALIIGGLLANLGQIAVCIGTGAGCVALGGTAAIGIGSQVALAVALNFIEPMIISYLAGTVAPDPEKDPLGGYGAGMAIAAGMGAFGSQLGRSNGLKPLTTDEFAALSDETYKAERFLARVDSELNPGATNTENIHSVRNQLALTFAPLTLAIYSKDIASVATSIGSVLGTVPTTITQQILPVTTAAEQTDYYRGELCADEDYKEMNLATDAFCNPIYAAPTELLEFKDPEQVIDWMIANEKIDADSGEPLNNFKDFLGNCVNGEAPLDGSDDSATKDCMNNDEETRFFRLYVMDNNISESIDASIDGTLGQQSLVTTQADTQTSTPSTPGDINGQYENGKIPSEVLCPLGAEWPGEQLQCRAAEDFRKLNTAYKTQFGVNISVTDSYRSYEDQVRVRQEKPSLAAVPGTSNHGWGLALDLGGGINRFGTPQYNWMLVNASRFGWFNPDWARQGGSKEEPWHWEHKDSVSDAL